MSRLSQVVLAGLVMMAGCGRSPLAPASPTSGLAALSITPASGMLMVGRSQQFAAFGVQASGTGGTVAATWSSDNAGVLTVDNNGLAKAVAPGIATVTVAASGRVASLRVQVYPDYSGSWSGGGTVVLCTSRLPASCGWPLFRVGAVTPSPIEAFLVQNQTRVVGRLGPFALSGEGHIVGGMVDEAGRVTVAGPTSGSQSVTLTGTLVPDGALEGTYTLDLAEDGSGTTAFTQRVTWNLAGFRRVSSAPGR